jgi:hypothetical protein
MNPLDILDDIRDELAAEATPSKRPHRALEDLREPEKPIRPLTVWAPSQFLAHTLPDDASLLGDGLIERGELASFLGVGGLGKSRLTLWFALCWIAGREWCGLPTAGGPGRVLILCTENGLRRWQTDLSKMLATFTDDERDAVEKHLRGLALVPGEEADMNLGDAASCARLRETLKAQAPDLLIFDPFADMLAGDENSTECMVATLRTLRGILTASAPRAAVILVHHARTGAANVAQAGDGFSAGNFARGSKALYSRVRAELQLAPGDRDDPTKLVLACGKASNCAPFAPRGLVFDAETFTYQVDPSFSVEGWRSDVAGKRTGKACSVAEVVAVVREHCQLPGDCVKAGMISDAVREATGASVRTIRDRLRDAVKAGYLRAGEVKGSYRLGSKPLPR